MRSGDLDEGAPELEPLAAETDFASLVKHLVDPVVIMNRRGQICFMNLRAERMLGGGLRKRLEAHLNSQPQRPAVSQVRFHFDGGADRILKIRLSGMKWMGEEATQVSLKDVTAYVTAAQRSAQEVEGARRNLEKTQVRPGQTEAQLKEMTANRDRVELQLESALSRLRQMQEERQRFEQQAAEARQAADQLKAARQELDELTERRAGELAEAGRQLAGQTEEMRKIKAEVALLQSSLAESARVDEENEQLRRKIAESERGGEELKARQSALEECARQQAEEARHQAEQAAKSGEELAQRVARTGEELALQTAELEKARAEVAQLRQSLGRGAGTDEENEQLRRKIAESERAAEELKARQSVLEERARQSTEDRARAGEQIQQRLAELKKSGEEAEQLRQEISDARKALAESDAARDRAQVEAGQLRQEIAESRRACEESNARRGELEKAAQAREEELEKATQALSQESAERKQAEEENERLHVQIAETRRDLAGVKSKCDDLEAKVRQRAADLAKLKEELRAEIALLEESQKQIELFRQEAGLSQQARAENERLRQEVAEALRAREESSAQLQKEAAERAAAQAEAQRLREHLSQEQQACEELQTQRVQIESQVNELAAAHEQNKAEMEKEMSASQRAREENEKLRQKIAASLQAAEASSEAQEWPDEGDPLRVGKVEKAHAKRRRELDSDSVADADGELTQEIGFECARVSEAGTSDANELLFSLLLECTEKGASDLHLASERQPYLRIHGRLQRMGAREELSAAQVQAIAVELMRGYDRAPLDSKGSLDGVMCAPDGTRFRFNISRAQHGLSVACRRMASHFKTLAELQLPEKLDQLCALKDGLVIAAGPAGAGKSTTLATLVDRINQTRRGHIITIEDPIEFVHQPASCLVNQRQVGIHASSFNDALVAALRQDPDVIMVGEMRDQDTIRTALTAAETGHLVFTTVHASDSIGAIERLLSAFSPEDQDHIRRQFAAVLRAIVSQHLLPIRTTAPGAGSNGRSPVEPWNAPKDRRSKADRRISTEPASDNVERRNGRDRRLQIREDRVPACEVLIVTPAIVNLIATNQLSQVYSFVESGSTRGMQTLDQDLARLCVAGKITEGAALGITRRPKVLQDHIAHLMRETTTGAT